MWMVVHTSHSIQADEEMPMEKVGVEMITSRLLSSLLQFINFPSGEFAYLAGKYSLFLGSYQ